MNRLKKVSLEKKVVTQNDRIASSNRKAFAKMGSFVINMVSSPGSGKTSLIEQTVTHLQDEVEILVITGDLMTDNDARRIQRLGVDAFQITTGDACHLDARMVSKVIKERSNERYDLVIIENVGNLVCPASFDLGEHAKVLLVSVTEGDDKPLKYPPMVNASKVLVVSKIDLIPFVESDPEMIIDSAHRINPDLVTFKLSSKTGEGIDQWIGWLRSEMEKKK
ncbi:MAG: hydrogenase nickel incorporation protein HypB [bacterium]